MMILLSFLPITEIEILPLVAAWPVRIVMIFSVSLQQKMFQQKTAPQVSKRRF